MLTVWHLEVPEMMMRIDNWQIRLQRLLLDQRFDDLVQELGCAARGRTLVTLGTPHAGTQAARFAGTSRCQELRPGSEVMQRIAGPMVGGLVSSTVLALVCIPAIYALWKGRTFRGR